MFMVCIASAYVYVMYSEHRPRSYARRAAVPGVYSDRIFQTPPGVCACVRVCARVWACQQREHHPTPSYYGLESACDSIGSLLLQHEVSFATPCYYGLESACDTGLKTYHWATDLQRTTQRMAHGTKQRIAQPTRERMAHTWTD